MKSLLTFTLIISIHFINSNDYRGYKLFRISICDDTKSWIEKLENSSYMINKITKERRPVIDIWTEPNKYKPFMDILVSPAFVQTFISVLKIHGTSQIQILSSDIQSIIDQQKIEHNTNSRKKRHDNSINKGNFDVQAYHRYEEIVEYMLNLKESFPELVQILNITKSFEKRDLIGIKIGKEQAFKPSFFIDAGIHAREWIAPATAIYIINEMLNKYGKDLTITKIVDNFDWYIVPVGNPDGYEYSITKDRLWRKTRSKNSTVNKWCVGVDVNRNWGYRWGETGTNRSPCSNIYAGSGPFSEPEAVGIKNFITWKIPDLKVYVSLHSYGQLFLSPWGYTDEKPVNYKEQIMAAKLAVEAIKNTTGANYHYGTISELMYPASGTSLDYMQDRGVPYIYAIELRPEENDNHGFAISSDYIVPSGKEIISALSRIATYIIEKN